MAGGKPKGKYIPRKPKPQKEMINEYIPFKEILVINEKNEKMGIMRLEDAVAYASNLGLDVFCVSPNSETPVCRVLDYGKYKYETNKNVKAQKKNQQLIKIKEIRLTPTISNHDLETKANQAIKFLKDGNRVKVSLKFRGREMEKHDIGLAAISRITGMIGDQGSLEKSPVSVGRFLNVLIIPKNN